MTLHQYADMDVLKHKLDSEIYDKVRAALGLQSLKAAIPAGQKISENIRAAVS